MTLSLALSIPGYAQETAEEFFANSEFVSKPQASEDEDGIPSINLVPQNPFVPQMPYEKKIVPAVETAGPDDAEEDIIPTVKGTPAGEVLPAVPIIAGAPKLVITGLIWNSDRPQAIVNGNVIEVGDRLFGVPTDKNETIPEIKFVDITKEGLTVSFMEQTVVLKPAEPVEY